MGSDRTDNDESDHDSNPEGDAATATSSATTANAVRREGESSRQGGIGETLGRAVDSTGKTLTQPGPKSQLTFVIGLFAVIGLGFGLTGIVVVELVAGGGSGFAGAILAVVFLISLLVVLLLTGSIVGAFCGLRVAEQLNHGSRTVYLTSFVGTAVGYLVMVVIATLLIGLVVSGGSAPTGGGAGTSFNILGLLLPLIILSLPVGVTGLGSSFLARRAEQ